MNFKIKTLASKPSPPRWPCLSDKGLNHKAFKRVLWFFHVNTCLKALSLKKATEKARVLKQEFSFKIQKVYISMKMSVISYSNN